MYKPPPPLSQRNPQVPASIESVVLRALAKEAGKRFSSAGDFARALAAATGVGTPVSLDTDTELLTRRSIFVLTTPDGREYPVPEGTVTIGRDIGNDIVLPVRQVSRLHAQIQCSQSECTLTDMGSTNRTFVNGMCVPPREPQPIMAGDVLGIGPVIMMVTPPSESDRLGPQTTSMELRFE
jgi:hypothetical protein